MADSTTDEKFLRRALDLAHQGIGLASPNPCVGAVIVDQNGDIVGEGSHTYAGIKHAEVIALQQAGERARGATLYINFEPCSHQGRTGPCVDAVIAAGIRRVVASISDPNPQVAGAGFERLRAAGVEVEIGGLQDEAKKLNESFARYIRHHIPLVTLKAAMTLDGKIGPPLSASPQPATNAIATPMHITGELSRAHVQELRHQNDAIMVGVGTVIADDPLLTDRSGKPRRRPLLRVILDSRLRLPLESRLVKTAQDDLLVLCSFAEEKKKRRLLNRGVQVEQIPRPTPERHPDLKAVVQYLGAREITSLMIEGGAMVNGAALASGIVDKIFFYYAPTILGGTNSVPFAAGNGFPNITDAARLNRLSLHRFGEDFAVEGYLRDPYEDKAVSS
jgi:diaminohydroxyphosphoribosylaminopyrimidine deaminase/5-amino-6-(5-phosphoribosylamino)uracil reductase